MTFPFPCYKREIVENLLFIRQLKKLLAILHVADIQYISCTYELHLFSPCGHPLFCHSVFPDKMVFNINLTGSWCLWLTLIPCTLHDLFWPPLVGVEHHCKSSTARTELSFLMWCVGLLEPAFHWLFLCCWSVGCCGMQPWQPDCNKEQVSQGAAEGTGVVWHAEQEAWA